MAPKTAVLVLAGVMALAMSCSGAGIAQTEPAERAGAGSDLRGTDGALDDDAGFSTRDWKTDFSKRSVSLSEITSGGPPKDGIPPVDAPKFVSASPSVDWLKDNEPVITLVMGNEARAYPLQVLIWHEIVNDTVAGVPVTVTFCPLCNTAIVFDRRLDGTVYDFGTTGNLRYSDLVMYDRQTESWWQQITGEAMVGELTGARLKMLPAAIFSYRDFRTAYPKGKVLSRDTGFTRSYGTNPYTGYDDISSSPFLFRGPSDKRLPPMERVVTVSVDEQDYAFPFRTLSEKKVIHHQAGNQPVAIFWSPGTASALDKGSIAQSQDIGATAVYKATFDGKTLSFSPVSDGIFRDRETGTEWNLAGQGVQGALAGRQLEAVTHGNHFWFAWAVFRPQTEIAQG